MNEEDFEYLDKDEEMKYFEKTGKITRKIREQSKKLIFPGASVLDIAETIEKMIEEEGVKPAFPPNISINEVAAHFTPDSNTKLELGENDVVKVDIGVQIKGTIGDTAYTIDLSGEHGKLVEASEMALENVISAVKPGIGNGELGKIAEQTITKYGFKPISNLNGHMIKRFFLHSGPIIPSVDVKTTYVLQEGDVFAIEPFASTGEGFTRESNETYIFSINSKKNPRSRQARHLLNFAFDNYFTSPFAKRWLEPVVQSKLLFSSAIKELVKNDIFTAYPVLVDRPNSFVSQKEVTIIVEKDGARILT